MGALDIDTAVAGKEGSYNIDLSPDWSFWQLNGGYLSAVALRAAQAETDHARPAAYYCHYLDAAQPGPATLTVMTLRKSSRTQSLRVAMTQNDRPVLEALVWTFAGGGGFDYDSSSMPAVPQPGDLRSYEEIEPGDPPFPFWHNIEGKPVTWRDPWATAPVMHPLWRSWYRFRPQPTFEDPFVDAGRSLILIDTMLYPAAALAHEGPFPFAAPSMDLAVRFHHHARDSEWLLSSTESPIGVDGLIGGYAAVWSDAGRLIATGGQQMIYRAIPGS